MNTLVKRNNMSQKINSWLPGMVFAATTLMCSVYAFADDQTIAGLGSSAKNILLDIYEATAGVVTVLAAVLFAFAFIAKMAGNQQQSQKASAWMVRIVACFIGFHCIGFILNMIENTTDGFGFQTEDHRGSGDESPADGGLIVDDGQGV